MCSMSRNKTQKSIQPIKLHLLLHNIISMGSNERDTHNSLVLLYTYFVINLIPLFCYKSKYFYFGKIFLYCDMYKLGVNSVLGAVLDREHHKKL